MSSEMSDAIILHTEIFKKENVKKFKERKSRISNYCRFWNWDKSLFNIPFFLYSYFNNNYKI